MLSADLIARAIIASARSYGDHPTAWATEGGHSTRKRAVAPAIYALKLEAGANVTALARTLGQSPQAVMVAHSQPRSGYRRALDASREVVRYSLRAAAERAAMQPAPAPAPTPRPLPTREPVKRPERAIPRGARIENLGGGVSVIRLKPITDSVVRHAQQQVRGGLSIDDAAEFFDVCPDRLREQLEARAHV